MHIYTVRVLNPNTLMIIMVASDEEVKFENKLCKSPSVTVSE